MRMWSVWCRALVGALLVALGASLELYEQLPASDDFLYQDDNDIDTGPAQKAPLPRVNDLMLRRLFNALQLQRIADVKMLNRPHILPLEGDERPSENEPDKVPFKDAVFKRLSEVYGAPAPAHRAVDYARPQQKWKIKKGKSLGSQMVCYFKLCAFRSPA